jgi:pSer/pThr/pTyr-binding forkhead associated (FHA) protein
MAVDGKEVDLLIDSGRQVGLLPLHTALVLISCEGISMMKRLLMLVTFLVLITTLSRTGAQNQETTYKLSLDDCLPRFWLPDSDLYVRDFNQSEYQNEQVVDLCVTVRDQAGSVQSNPQITNIVISAADASGNPVKVVNSYDARLPGDDFTYEIIFLLDTSQSMSSSIGAMKRAARTAIQKSPLPNPYYAVYTFSTTAESTWPLTQKYDVIESQINSIQVTRGGATCLYDAINTALQTASVNQWARRVIILFTDGKNDNHQGACIMTSDDEIIQAAKVKGVSVYAIGLGQGVDRKQLDLLTGHTFGAAEYASADNLSGLPGLFEAILAQLNSMRIVRTTICGTGTITLTMRASVNDKATASASKDVELGNTQCMPPTAVPEIAPTATPVFAELRVSFPSFEISLNAQAQDIATVKLSVTNRPDIARVQAQIIDSSRINAPPQPVDCTKQDNVTYQCAIDVSALKIGDLTVQVNVLDANGNMLRDQPFTDTRQKQDRQPFLQILPRDGNLEANITFPGMTSPPSNVSFMMLDRNGTRSPLPSIGSENGPYILNMEDVNADTMTVEARITYGTNTKTVTLENVSLERTFGQNLARFLRVNSLLIGAMIVMAGGGVGWLLWRGKRGPQPRPDEWLRGPVPDSTQLYAGLPSPTTTPGDDATHLYESKSPIGDLEIIRLTSDPAREGVHVTVKTPFTLGRAATCDLVIADGFLSRVHLSITERDALPFIEDLDSSNGTIVNGQALKPNEATLLKNGAEITLGPNVALRFCQILDQETRVGPLPSGT